MRCPHCGHSQSRVIETRESDEAIRRRRQCEACRLRFTTYERAQFPRLVIRAASGAQRNFTRGWLAGALRTSGVELPGPTLTTIAAAIEAQLRATGRRVVTTEDVGAFAARQVALLSPFGGASPTADQLAMAMEATLPQRRSAVSQLPLPIDR